MSQALHQEKHQTYSLQLYHHTANVWHLNERIKKHLATWKNTLREQEEVAQISTHISESDIQPYSEFVLYILPIQSAHTHTHQWTHTHTHTPWTHTRSSEQPFMPCTAPGEQLGVRCLAQGHLVVVLKVERALYIYSPPLPTIPAGTRLELTTFRLWVRLSTIRN